MKKYLTLALLLPAIFAFAQLPASKHSLALVVSPDLSYVREVNDAFQPNHQAARLGYRVRLDYFRRLGPRIFLKTGLGYATMNLLQITEGSNLTWPSQNNGNGQYDPTQPGENTDVRLRQSFHFLQIPVGLRFQLSKGRLHWIAELESGLTLRLEKANQQGVQPYAGIATGLEISRPSGWAFSAQPAYRYHLRSNYPPKIAGTFDNRSFLQSLGLELAVRRNF